MNTRTRQKIKATLGRKNPEIFATIHEGGMTRVQFVARSERDLYKQRYGDNIIFWDEEQRNERTANHRH